MEVQNKGALEHFEYDDGIVRKFVAATMIWGIVAFLVGVIIASQMFDWRFNFGLPWLTFGRLRPLHTNAAIFAFAGNAIFAGIYYSTQRLLKARMFSDALSKVHFWGWQLIIVSAALTLPFGITVGKEYAELEWPIAKAVEVIWVVFAINFFGTIYKRREKHIYVAIWFYIATIVTVAMLHIVNTINLPVGFLKSYPIYAGAQDALVQWWYGHNAVAFFLTTPFLGLMYYFMPKMAERPVYSYRLSIVHFWSLVFMYIWAGPHHLLYTALPEWAQTLGMVFSVMLWAPSWGGMINGLLTLRGVWHRVPKEPILKFMVAGLTFYGMSTFEGPLLSIKSVNLLAHYTDWIIAHVHGGALGWNGFITFGIIYWIVPRLWKTKLYSEAMANAHFWLGLLGIVLYMLSMWIAGITQGLMWQGIDAAGKLVYPDFVETVIRIVPLFGVRLLGGLLFFVGALIMAYNIIKTIQTAPTVLGDTPAQGYALRPAKIESELKQAPHRMLEGWPLIFTALTLVAVTIGGIIEIAPTFLTSDYFENVQGKIKPYTPLELEGRDIYVREGCYTCHSQMIRPTSFEVLRYGDYSRIEESAYDYPFQWGSKRTGPDLARIGGKYPNLWHYRHMRDPREVVPGSIMPAYSWLLTDNQSFDKTQAKIKAMKLLGVPYTDAEVETAVSLAKEQAAKIVEDLTAQGVAFEGDTKEIISLIAYMQRLGIDFKKSK